jgi:hypothetical protein
MNLYVIKLGSSTLLCGDSIFNEIIELQKKIVRSYLFVVELKL